MIVCPEDDAARSAPASICLRLGGPTQRRKAAGDGAVPDRRRLIGRFRKPHEWRLRDRKRLEEVALFLLEAEADALHERKIDRVAVHRHQLRCALQHRRNFGGGSRENRRVLITAIRSARTAAEMLSSITRCSGSGAG